MSERLAIALIGAGQLGGSFALALREGGAEVHITAYDALTENAHTLHQRGAVDAVATNVTDAVKNADIVVLASPLRTYPKLAEQITGALAPHAIVTDLGSVKRSMQHLGLPAARVVPGHPIAGGEKSGPAVARGDLFKGKLVILTPGDATDAEALRSIETLWHATGAEVLAMPTDVHDQIYAYVSHLPHYIAFAAAEQLFTLGGRIEADDTTLQQFLRISRSNPRMWTDIALENREALLPALATNIAVLDHFAGELRAGEPGEAGDKTQLAKTLLPRILAGSLISSVSLYEQQSGMNLRAFGAGGLRDIVAPAATTPEGDMEAISHQASAIADLVDQSIALLRRIESLIGAEDETALFQLLSDHIQHAHALVTPRQ